MKNVLFGITILLLLIIPFVSADIITPGYTPIKIKNIITNINGFPDYIFITTGGEFCPVGNIIQLIEENGVIPEYYKFCSPSVYAVPKVTFAANNINLTENWEEKDKELNAYLSSLGAKEVISNIDTYTEVPITSTQKDIVNYYTVDLDKVKTAPDNQEIKRSNLIYFYIIIPIIALIIIVFIIISRRRK